MKCIFWTEQSVLFFWDTASLRRLQIAKMLWLEPSSETCICFPDTMQESSCFPVVSCGINIYFKFLLSSGEMLSGGDVLSHDILPSRCCFCGLKGKCRIFLFQFLQCLCLFQYLWSINLQWCQHFQRADTILWNKHRRLALNFLEKAEMFFKLV